MLNFIRKIKEQAQIELAEIEEQVAKMEVQQSYIALNNLYLELERGDVEMNLNFHLALRTLVVKANPDCHFMQEWWMGELQKLPNWLDY